VVEDSFVLNVQSAEIRYKLSLCQMNQKPWSPV
jgi:hypothetical protein